MKSLAPLVFTLIGLAVVYAIYWAKRAAQVSKDAKYVLDHGGSLAEAVAFVKDSQRIPDEIRLSARQNEYVDANFKLFMTENRERIENLTMSIALREATKNNIVAGEENPHFAELVDKLYPIAVIRVGKMWCEERSVF